MLRALQTMMMAAGAFFLLGAGLQAGSHSLAQLIVGRAILGFGVGERVPCVSELRLLRLLRLRCAASCAQCHRWL